MLRSLIEDTPLREVAVLLADVIRMTPQPLTLVLEGLLDDGTRLRLDADHPGSRPVDAGKGRHEDSRLIPGGLNQLTCRTARLTCPGPDGDLTVARTELGWLEQRIPYDACRELRQGTEPAGKYVATRHDPVTGLIAYSLYGSTRKPTPTRYSVSRVLLISRMRPARSMTCGWINSAK